MADVKDHSSWKQEFQQIIHEIQEYHPTISSTDIQTLNEVFLYICENHKEDALLKGKNYITHILEVLRTLIKARPDIITIQGAMLHGMLYHEKTSYENIKETFGEEVSFLLKKYDRLTRIRDYKTRDPQESKKLLLTIAQDVRVIYIELADMIHDLRDKDFTSEKEMRITAEQVIQIYAPIAEKLNLYQYKVELEDAAFQILQPDIFRDIQDQLQKKEQDQESLVGKAILEIQKILKAESIPYTLIEGRSKNPYSIYQKLKRKNYTSLQEIFDLTAIRIIVQKETDCYRVLGLMHAHWKPIPKRFKDYIAVPKPNGYQSLHTTILGLHDSPYPIEIQIKTKQMHETAEFGKAAHWSYKQKKSPLSLSVETDNTDWLPQISSRLDDEDNILERDMLFQDIMNNISCERIHIFTPKGELKDLPKGSTPIDFAYSIHSSIGDTTVGAKINGTMRPLNYELSPGDVVEVLTKQGRHPNPLWLNFVKSSHAKAKIRHYLNQLESEDTPKEKEDSVEIPSPSPPKKSKPSPPKTEAEIIIGGARSMSYRIPKCCSPKPFKEIIAYNTRGLDFTIHRQDCKLVPNLNPERILEAYYLKSKDITLLFHDRVGILQDLTRIATTHNVNINATKSQSLPRQYVELTLSIGYGFDEEIETLIAEWRKVPNIESIQCQR